MKTFKFLMAALFLMSGLFLMSCNKDDDDDNSNNNNNTGKTKYLAQIIMLEPGDSNFVMIEYNSAKKVSKVISKDGTQAITEIQTFTYDAGGKLINTKTFEDAVMTILTSQTNYTYSGTLLTSAVEITQVDTTNYTYSFANSKLAVVESIRSDGKNKTTYTWTGDNITKEETMYDDLSGGGYIAEGYTTYTHDTKINPMFKFGIIMDDITFLNKNNYLIGSFFDANNIPIMQITATYIYNGDYPTQATIDYGFGTVIQKFSYVEM